MPLALTLADLLDSLDSGEPLVMPSSRAARELRTAFDASRRALGLTAWEPAPVFSWQQWTASLWSDLVVAGVEIRLLLNAAQEHSLWREIVAEDRGHRTLGSPDSLAELAQSAWELAAAYSATAYLEQFFAGARWNALNPDSRIFSQWAAEFRKRCGDRCLLSTALLDDALAQHVVLGALPAPGALQLAGFGDLTPSREGLLTALRKRGTTVTKHDLTTSSASPPLRASVIAAHPHDELQLAARWVRGYLEEHRGSRPRVAILVPNLTEERAELDSVLREVLAPELQSIAADLSSAPWEISSTIPLASLAIISDALNLVQWTLGPLSIESAGTLLLSPYLGDRSQRDALAHFDAKTLRRQSLLRPEIDFPGVLRLLSSSDPHTPTPVAWLHNVNSLAQRAASVRVATYADWMEHIRVLLAAARWPGSESHTLTATEYEATRAWDGVLDLVATLDFSGRRVPFDNALEALRMQASRTLFTPPATRAPVQVMRVAEAEGCLFDAIVFLRSTDTNWPPPEHAHPLLPLALQRSLSMPGADAARAAQRARAFTTALLQRAATVLFTSSAADDDGKLRPSPLIAELGLTQLSPEQLCVTPPHRQRINLETVADDSPLPPLAHNTVAGGARVLQLQAACGFRAFAEFRLHAKELETIDLGFDAAESGRRLHGALQLFWKEVETQDALRSMPSDDRDRKIRKAVDLAMARHLHPHNAWDVSFITLQKERLTSLLQQWLDTELQRGPFKVRESEQMQPIHVGPLTLDVRFDRIDKVDDGFVLVDYKTGASGHPNQWKGPRPDDPQLPLYALPYEPHELKGLAFAKVRVGKMKWLGYQTEPGILPPSRVNEVVDLSATVEVWRATLTQLAQDFADGRANVAPRLYPRTCEHCPQRILCRLDPATLAPPEGAGEETGDEEEAWDE
jgi:probable DNA repair protein